MLDRVPTPGQEGRVKVTPEGGAAYFAKLEMADNPTNPGTPLNKANLLSDATAAALASAIGMTLPTTVNEALSGLAVTPLRIATGSYTGTGTYGITNKNSLTFSFTPKLVLISMRPVSESQSIGSSDIFAFVWGQSLALPSYDGGNRTPNSLSYNGNTAQWYNSSSAVSQFNYSGGVIQDYFYVAIG